MPDAPTNKPLHYALWVVQILLALLFTAAGLTKVTSPIDSLVESGMLYAADMPWAARLAGAAELFGVIGLIVPSITRIAPKTTAAAAAGLALVMLLAIGMHGSRGELGVVPANLIIGGLAAFVAWGRAVGAPIPPR